MTTWPFRPNWRRPYAVTYKFKTEIITSRRGREQRRAQRDTPRKSIEFMVTAGQERWRRLQRTLSTLQGPLLDVPDISSSMVTDSDSATGSNIFHVGATPSWLVHGAKVLLTEQRSDRVEVRTIQGFGLTSLAFAESNTAPWPVGTIICHLVSARLADSIKLRSLTQSVAEGRVTFDVDPGAEPILPGAEPDSVWNGRELFSQRVNWASGMDVTFQREFDPVDYGKGRAVTYLPVGFGGRLRVADLLLRTRSEADRLRAFFYRMRGRQGEFYIPMPSDDMALAVNLNGGFSNLQVVGTEIAESYAADPVHRAIYVLMHDGRRFYRGVSSMTTSLGRSVLQLAQPAPFTITPATVASISWLPVCRLASDDLTIEWVTDGVAKSRLSFVTLEALAPE